MMLRALSVAILTVLPISHLAHADQHAVAMHGAPKYGPDFRHFDYVNPAAPKGWKLTSTVPQVSFPLAIGTRM